MSANRDNRVIRLTLALVAVALPAGLAWAQDAANNAADEPEPKEVTIGEQGSSQDPLAGREPALLVEPQRRPGVKQVQGLTGLPSVSIKLDPRVLGIAPGEPLPRLRREGEALRKRDGRLLPPGDRGYAVFIADADPEAGDDRPVAMVLAPCMILESMERLYEDRGEDLRFTITGEVHTYRGVNYLLPTSQPRPWLVTDQPPDVEETAGDTPAETNAPPKQEATQETDNADADADPNADAEGAADGDTAPGDTKSADEVLQELLDQRDDTPTLDDRDTESTSDKQDAPAMPAMGGGDPGPLSDPLLIGLDSDQPQAELKPEGTFIVARAGRLIRSADGAHALFVLNADQRSAPEPPMIVQACKLLETMEKTVLDQGENVAFVVTGQVFVYRGANYLLPTIVRQEFDRGNLE